MRFKAFLTLAVFLMAIPLAFSQSNPWGCCLNPLADKTIVCYTPDQDNIYLSNCCSTDPNDYPSSSNGEVPTSYEECSSDFFVEGLLCDDSDPQVQACNSAGCCCTTSGGVKSSEITAEPFCIGTGKSFQSGITDDAACLDACGVTQCNNGLDDDGNGCSDYLDTSCDGPGDNSESGGECRTPAEAGCANIDYTPSIEFFVVSPVKGERKLDLQWENECSENVVTNDIFRCEGVGCTDFGTDPIGSTPFNTFTDESNLKFGVHYTYKVQTTFSVQTATSSSTSSGSMGDLECWNKFDSSLFCIHESYYNQYKQYLIDNQPGFSEAGFLQSVRDTFGTTLNKAFACNVQNVKQENIDPVCTSSQVCVVVSGDKQCYEASGSCTPDENNPFGLFYTVDSCEMDENDVPQYCFYDRSFSTVDACFSCNTAMSCYDYKSESACSRDNCHVQNCVWKSLDSELGTGVCINEQEDNCQWCDQTGTAGMQSAKSTSAIFEQCTQQKANLLSSGDNVCYYNGQSALNCKEVSCSDYEISECSNSQITFDQDNVLQTRSNDKCGIGTCQVFGSVCKKNADGDANADCATEECENDVYPPDTTIVPNIKGGSYESLSIRILDQTVGTSSAITRTSGGYKTYICLGATCGTTGHPYSASTDNFLLKINNLRLIDDTTGEILFTLNDGPNTLKYYSQDPSKNIGAVKTIDVNSPSNNDGPVICADCVTVEGATRTNGIFYTTLKAPSIDVEFSDPSIITSARLIYEETGVGIGLNYDTSSQKLNTLTLSNEVNDGNYILEINARGENGIYMDVPYRVGVVIDGSAPQLLSLSPSDGELIESGEVTLTIQFDDSTRLNLVTINGVNVTGSFSSSDDITFSGELDLEDGNKGIEIQVEDFAGNPASFSSSFVINADPLLITLSKPSHGVSDIFIFDLEVNTDNDASCRFNLNGNIDYSVMSPFSPTGGTSHVRTDFSQITDSNVQKLNVKCMDPVRNEEAEAEFDLSVDTSPPTMNEAFANPNPIAEVPRRTVLKVEANKEVVCKYHTSNVPFEQMTGLFPEFGNVSFDNVNSKEIVVDSDGSFTYHVACMGKNELVSETRTITFTSDITQPITITSNTLAVSDNRNIVLAIETNKLAVCRYSSSESGVSTGPLFSAQASYAHTATLNLPTGLYTYYVICKDQYSDSWSSSVPISFTIDETPPSMLFVEDNSTLSNNPDFTWRTDKLRARWLGQDNETDIHSYWYTIEESGSFNTVLDWTVSFEENEWIWALKSNGSGLDLLPGAQYIFKVKAKNNVGRNSTDALSSDGITVDPSLKPANCSNGVKDGSESDIDCGGSCDLCGEGLVCLVNSDCLTGYCSENVCTGPTCSDSIQNQDETDTDCGGDTCSACEIGSSCSDNDDCVSNYCAFGTCQEADQCHDGRLSGTESDVDCGGACPTKCGEGQSCDITADCIAGAVCMSGQCTVCSPSDIDCDGIPNDIDTDVDGDNIPNDQDDDVDGDNIPNNQDDDIDGDGIKNEDDPTPYGASSSTGDKDTDGDGIPDSWELEMGLDPNDSTDADADYDNDGLTNREEYVYRTNPNKADTDGDGASDKKEIDKGTDPRDPDDKPGGFLGIILWILLVLVILAAIGVGVYYYMQNSTPKKSSKPMSVPRYMPSKPILRTSPKSKTGPSEFTRKEAERRRSRDRLLANFGSSSNTDKKDTSKTLISKTKPKESQKPDIKKKPEPRRPKEDDVFKEVKLLSREEHIKKIKSPKKREGKKDSLQKLKKISSKRKKRKK